MAAVKHCLFETWPCSCVYCCFVVCGVTEAQIRFLKAKLRVMQEELDRLSAELSAKVRHFAFIHHRIALAAALKCF